MGSRRDGPPSIEGLYSLKVDNLSYNCSIYDLKRMFERYGDIGDVHIPRDRRTNQSRGFGFVRFYDRKDAEYALDRVDGRRVSGRNLRVSMAKYNRPIDERARRRNHSRSPKRRSRSPRRSRTRSPPARSQSRSRSPPSKSRSRSPALNENKKRNLHLNSLSPSRRSDSHN